MRIILATDPPWAPTANAVQMGELAKRLQADMHTVMWMPRWGFSTGGTTEWQGIEVLPGDDEGGNAIMGLHVKMKGAQLVISRGYAGDMKFGGSDYAWFAWHPGAITRRILRKAKLCIAVSHHEQEQLEQISGVMPKLIPRGIIPAYSSKPNKAAEKQWRYNHRVPDDAFLCSVIGDSDPNWTRLLEAFKLFYERHENALLYLHTDSTRPVDLLEYAKKIDFPQAAWRVPDGYNLQMGYYNETVAAMYHTSSVHLVPSMSAHPIIEAMACGTPVLATEHAESKELMSVDGLGALVPPALMHQGYPLLDIDGWVAELENAYQMSDEEMVDHRACCQMAVQHYHWDELYERHWKPLLETFAEEETSRAYIKPLKEGRPDKRDSKFLTDLGFVEEFECEVIRKTDIGGSVQDEEERNEKVKSWGEHPNIIRILREGVDEHGNYYFDTPKLTPLEDIKEFTKEEGDKILEGIRAGLDFMHEHGAAHCDINPTNILVDGDGRAIIFDFDFMIDGLDPRLAHLCDYDPLHPAAMPYAVPIMQSGMATRGFHRVLTHVRNLPFKESHATSKPDMPYQQIEGYGERDCDVRWELMSPDVRGKRVLDLGTNLGYFAARSMQEGAKSVYAVDRDAAIIEAARTLHPELNGNAVQMNLDDTLPEGEFDVAFCLSVWMHLRKGKRPLLEFLKTIPVVYWEDANLTKPDFEQMGFQVERLTRSERGRNLFKLTSKVPVHA